VTLNQRATGFNPCTTNHYFSLKSSTYKALKLDGLKTLWCKNGKKYFESTYTDGLKDGVCTEWGEQG